MKNEEKLISFIIPVYNVEKYIRNCVESMLEQVNDECEIILIDDGSTDTSVNICDEYARANTLINVIHKNNGGLASARNSGINIARGKYLAFVDSDDYLDNGCVAKILEWIKTCKADICFMQAFKVFPNGKKEQLDDNIKGTVLRSSKLKAIEYLTRLSKFPGSACTKIFNKRFIDAYQLRFPEDRRVSEDLGFVLKCIFYADSYDVLPFNYYYYRQSRIGSITNKVNYKSFLGLQKFIEESSEFLFSDYKTKGEIEKYMLGFVAYEYTIAIWQYSILSISEQKVAKVFLEKYMWVMSFSRITKVKLVKIILKTLGINYTSNILNLYMRNR